MHGLDPHAVGTERDPLAQEVNAAVIDRAEQRAEELRQDLAVRIANGVGRALGGR